MSNGRCAFGKAHTKGLADFLSMDITFRACIENAPGTNADTEERHIYHVSQRAFL